MAVNTSIIRNKLALLKNVGAKPKVYLNSKLVLARNDCSLFSKLYIACQTRSGDLDMFFAHENQPNPPALSADGNLRLGSKADLLSCLESVSDICKQECPTVDGTVLDGAAIVQMLHPNQCKTFSDYATKVFIPYVRSQLSRVSRLDLVWDQYKSDSLKATTRFKRGSGSRRKVLPSADLPRNWADFLHNASNKTELFQFLNNSVFSSIGIVDGKQIVLTEGSHALCHDSVVPSLDLCSHEEADTRMLLHVANIAQSGHTRIMIRTVDTDVVVLATACFQHIRCAELWIAFGTGQHLRYLAIHDLAASMGPDRTTALLFFHAFTGCDTVSCFLGHGKKSAWETWKSFPEVTACFVQLSSEPADIQPFMADVQRFVVLLYDRSSNKTSVNALRKHLFTKKGRPMEALPPSEAALLQHVKRAVYQSGFCWYRSLLVQQNLPSPAEWGWQAGDDGQWRPLWTVLPDIAKCCPELVKCGCTKGCGKRCKCVKAKSKCTALCNCDGECNDASDDF